VLVLLRKIEESIMIDLRKWGLGVIEVKVIDSVGNVRLGLEGDRRIPIHRQEVFDDIETQRSSTL